MLLGQYFPKMLEHLIKISHHPGNRLSNCQKQLLSYTRKIFKSHRLSVEELSKTAFSISQGCCTHERSNSGGLQKTCRKKGESALWHGVGMTSWAWTMDSWWLLWEGALVFFKDMLLVGWACSSERHHNWDYMGSINCSHGLLQNNNRKNSKKNENMKLGEDKEVRLNLEGVRRRSWEWLWSKYTVNILKYK